MGTGVAFLPLARHSSKDPDPFLPWSASVVFVSVFFFRICMCVSREGGIWTGCAADVLNDIIRRVRVNPPLQHHQVFSCTKSFPPPTAIARGGACGWR